jgi:2-polyprenyl-3-methyl-5-hydroxy-6-metoxy-1,4-benzoquinol methylase
MPGNRRRPERAGEESSYELNVPAELPPGKRPALLKYWYLGSKARRYMIRRRLAAVVGLLGGVPAGRALDIGCGWGSTLAVLARRGFRAVGIDLVDDGFPAACCLAPANGVEFDLVRGDAARLPFGAGVFQAATAVEVLEHVYEADRERVFDELYRVLVPGGILALSTPNYGSLVEFGKRVIVKFKFLRRFAPFMHYPTAGAGRNEYHPFEYHLPVRRRQLEAMARKAGFNVVRAENFLFVLKNTPDRLFAAAHFLERMLERVPPSRGLAATSLLLAAKRKGDPGPSAPERNIDGR